jgi:hypothetical protein
MTWGIRTGAWSRRLTPLAAAVSLTMAAGISASPLPEFDAGIASSELPHYKGADKAWGSPRGKSAKMFEFDPEAVARYTIVFKQDPVVPHLAKLPSPPRIASGRPQAIGRLDLQSTTARNYQRQVEAAQAVAVAEFESQFARRIEPVLTMQHAINAVVVDITPQEASLIAARPDVELVEREIELPLHTFSGPNFIGAPTIWDGSASGQATKGAGLVVGIIDSGVNFSSPAFAAVGPVDGHVHVNPRGTGEFLGTCAAGGPDAGLCNDKLIGAYNFATSGASAADTDGHGSHTASTVAGNIWEADLNGTALTLSGVAPNANVIIYKACPTTSCPSAATTASVNRAVIDGVDVINYSIGGGTSPWTDTPSVAFRNAVAAGVFVAASAGNDGPGSATSSHLEPWVETVAASTHDSQVAATFSLTAPGTPPAETQDIVVVPGATPWPASPQVDVPLIKSPSFADGSNDGCSAFDANTFTRTVGDADVVFRDGFEAEPFPPEGRFGGIAVLHLDGDASACASGTRRANALAAGATGVLFVDDDYLNLGASGTTWSMRRADWDAVEAAMDFSTDTASITQAGPVPAEGDVVADFSSRGPSLLANGQVLIKPEITAPGVNILATSATSQGTGGATSIEFISGTSMSGPHVAGAATLIRALNPTWTPMQVKSALNLTANRSNVVDFDGSPAGIFTVGSGRVDLSQAANVGLVLDDTAANMLAANPATGGDVSTVNLAQFASGRCIGTCSFQRTVRRARAGSQTYNVEVEGLPAGTFTITPGTFTINSSGSRVIDLSIRGDLLPPAAWAFGEVVLTPVAGSEPTLRMPIAVNSFGPVIDVDPESIATTGSQTVQLEIANVGNPQLDWELETTAVTLPWLNSSFVSSGQLGGFYVGSSQGFYWHQNFDVGPGATQISRLQANGFVLPGSVSLSPANTTQISFDIFDESGVTPGLPAGAPEAFGAPARWSYSAPIGSGGVDAVGGFVSLDLTDPSVPALNLPEGRYWLTVYPRLIGTPSQTVANPIWAWFTSPDPQIGNVPVRYAPTINPGFTVSGTTFLMSGIIEGTVDCTLPDWLEVGSTSGSLGLGGSEDVPVTIDAAGLAPGEYSARICIRSNAVNRPELAVPVTLTIPATPFVEKGFAPASVQVGDADPVELTITLSNPTPGIATLTSDLVDTFPAGLNVALPSGAATTCPNGNVTTGASSVTLAAGAQIPAGGSCTVTVDVEVPATDGEFVNEIPAGGLQTDVGDNFSAANATLDVAAPALCTGQLLLDPGFESSDPGSLDNEFWASTSTNGGTSICNAGVCGSAAQRSGSFYLWFGGWGSAAETGTASQSVVIPSGFDRSIRFWMRRNAAAATDPQMTVSIDGDVLATYPRVTASETAYVQYDVPVPAQYADDDSHEIEFRFSTAGGANMGSHFVDDVTLECSDAPPSVSKSFAPDLVVEGEESELTLELEHPFDAVVTLTDALVDVLPAGIVLAADPAAATTCPSGLVTAVAGSDTVSLAAGAKIPAAGCNVTVMVEATAAGLLENTIPAGALQTNFGNSVNAASATIRVLTAAAQDDEFGFEAGEGFAVGPINGQQGWAATSAPAISALQPDSGAQHLRITSSATRPLVFSPDLATGAGRYSSVSARLRISQITNGSNWQFQPQDSPSGVLAAQVIFDRAVARPIRVLEFNGGTAALVDTVGVWPVDQYFQFEMVFDRQDQTLQLCLDGASIYSNSAAYVSGLVTDVFLAMQTGGTGTAGNTFDVDNLTVTSGDTGGCAAPRGTAAPRSGVDYSPRQMTDVEARAATRGEIQPTLRQPR